jgi:GABA permease
MAFMRNVLVVANVTATAPELRDRLVAMAADCPTRFNLILPTPPLGEGRQAAVQRLDEAVRGWRDAGLDADGQIGDADPVIAVTEAWDPTRHDEIVVSTLPMRFSKWLHAGLPERIAKLTGAPVTHVVSQPPAPEVETVPPPQHEKHGLITPLYGIGVGQPKPH